LPPQISCAGSRRRGNARGASASEGGRGAGTAGSGPRPRRRKSAPPATCPADQREPPDGQRAGHQLCDGEPRPEPGDIAGVGHNSWRGTGFHRPRQAA